MVFCYYHFYLWHLPADSCIIIHKSIYSQRHFYTPQPTRRDIYYYPREEKITLLLLRYSWIGHDFQASYVDAALCSVLFDYATYGLWSTRLLCPWNFPERILKWVAISSFRWSSQPWDRNFISWQVDSLSLNHLESQIGTPYSICPQD